MRPPNFAAGFVSPEEAKPRPVPAHHRLRTNDRDRPQHIGLNVIEGREKQSIPSRELWSMADLTLEHGNLVAENNIFCICWRYKNKTPKQGPDDRLQNRKHRGQIVARFV